MLARLLSAAALALCSGALWFAHADDMPLLGVGTTKTAAAPCCLLDSLSATAFVAYSTRKLRSAYAGSALQGNNQAGTTQTNIGFVGNDLDTGALHTLSAGNDVSVHIWYDQSPAGTNANANNGQSREPVIRIATTDQVINGHVCPQMTSGTNLGNLPYVLTRLEFNAGATVPQPWTLAFVFQLVGAPGAQVQGDVILGSNGANNNYVMNSGGTAFAASTTDLLTHGIVGTAASGPTCTMFLDNTSIGSSSTCGSSGAYQTQTMALGLNGQNYLCEILGFTSVLGTTDRATLKTSWHNYWGTP